MKEKERKATEERIRKAREKYDAIKAQKKRRSDKIAEYFDLRISDTALERFFEKTRDVGMTKAEQTAVWRSAGKMRAKYRKEVLAELMRAIDKILPVKGE